MNESVEKTYDRYSPVYDFLYGWVLANGRKKLARKINSAGGKELVEIGVGSGLMLPLYSEYISVTGVDVSHGMLTIAQKRAEKLKGRKINLVRIDGERSFLDDESFDDVVLPYVYSVTSNPEKLVVEAFRLCRPGGRVWILNHFSGVGNIWDIVGWVVKAFPESIGFRSDFPYSKYVLEKQWTIESVDKANLFGLSRILQLKKPI